MMRLSYATWVAAIGRHYRAILALSALLAVLSALSLFRVRLDMDVLNMLPRGTPAFDDFKAFVGDFGQLDELYLVIDGAPPDELHRFVDALTPRLTALDTIASAHGRIDGQQILDGLLGTYLFNYIPEDAYAQIAERLTPEGIDAQVAVDRAILSAPFDLSTARAVADDPLGLRRVAGQHLAEAAPGGPGLDAGYFASRDGTAVLMIARPRGSGFDLPFSQRLLEQVNGAVADAKAALGADGPRVRVGGSYVFAVEDASTIRADIHRYTVLALLGVLGIFYLGYGNLRILPFVTYPLIVTTLATFALSLLLYSSLNAVSLCFAAILYGLSIDSGIYFYSRLLDERRRAGGDVQRAITATLAGLGRANVVATSTTAGAFAVIGLSILSAVRQLGVLTAIGMGFTTLEFFILYPALGFWIGGGRSGELRATEMERLGRWADAARRRARVLRVAMVIAAAALAFGALHVHLDPTLDALRPGDSSARRVQDEIEARFANAGRGGAVLVRRPDLDDALGDGERVATTLRAYRDRGLLRSVQTVDAVLPSERTQRARLARYNALPRAEALRHLESALRAQGFKPEGFSNFVTAFAQPRSAIVRPGDPALQPLEFVIDHHLHTRAGQVIVAAYLEPADGVEWPAIAAQLRTDLADVPIAIAARPLLEHELGDVLRGELRKFLILAFLGNLLLLVVLLRDLRLALAILAPVALVVLALFAGMALAGIAVDPINLIVPPLLVGIGVDNGVYLAAAVRQRGSVGNAVRVVGRAIVITSFTTIAGFGFLAFSTYPPLATMGRLMAIGLSLCLAGTLFLLPALLVPTNTTDEHGSNPAAPMNADPLQ